VKIKEYLVYQIIFEGEIEKWITDVWFKNNILSLFAYRNNIFETFQFVKYLHKSYFSL
jgi:hypothetical protein